MKNILIIDDEKEIGNFLSHLFRSKGYHVTVINSGKEFGKLHFDIRYDAAMIDLKLPDADGLTLLRELKIKQPRCKAIIMTGYSTIHTAVEAMKLGACDYIEKPFDDIDLLEKQIDDLLFSSSHSTNNFINEIAQKIGLVMGTNHEMKKLLHTAYKVAQKYINVLIEGETGTGKEVLARFIHESSGRSDHAFIGVNCGAISESLLESELFGHEKGSFTGAVQQRKGLFEIASKGTLFLDEVVEASNKIQIKLLRVLETKEFMRVGSEQILRTNTRLVAASNENLQEAVQHKKFREDLYYRLNVVHLKIPPLRERREDIPILLQYFLQREADHSITFSKEAIEVLQDYSWPGNIRELANFVTRIVAMSDSEDEMITPSKLSMPSDGCTVPEVSDYPPHSGELIRIEALLKKWVERTVAAYEQKDKVDLEEVLCQIKSLESEVGKAFIQRTLKDTHGNRKETAKRLQISMRKLRYLLNEKNISSSIQE